MKNQNAHLTTQRPIIKENTRDKRVPVNTYSDFVFPEDASLKRRIVFAAIRNPRASYCDSMTNIVIKILSVYPIKAPA